MCILTLRAQLIDVTIKLIVFAKKTYIGCQSISVNGPCGSAPGLTAPEYATQGYTRIVRKVMRLCLYLNNYCTKTVENSHALSLICVELFMNFLKVYFT